MSSPRNAGPSSKPDPLPGASVAGPVRRSGVYYAWVVLFFSANLATLALLGLGHYAIAVAVFFLPAPWFIFQVLKPTARGLGPVVTRFATPRREVWLTIDDGPDPESTPATLDLLEAHGAHATFFLIGEKVLRHPELVSQILQRGHSVGNHTQTHPCSWFWCATAKRTAAEIDACADALRQAGAGDTRWFRPPVGLKNHSLHPLLAQRGLDLVLWNARGFDTVCRNPATALARIVAGLQPGAIILVHENEPGPALLSSLLDHLKREDFACVIPSADYLVRTG